MKLAILGTRGIPARYGGFETFAEQLAIRLARSGIDVAIFCPTNCRKNDVSYQGVTLKYIKSPPLGKFSEMIWDAVCFWVARRDFDVVYMLGVGGGFAAWIPRIFGSAVWINPDGIEWKRAKWTLAQRAYLAIAEALSVLFATRIVADAAAIEEYLRKRYRGLKKISTIAYGADIPFEKPKQELIEEWGLKPDGYYIVVCRLEPENHIVEMIEGYNRSNSSLPLIILGNIENPNAYVRTILLHRSERVRFEGTVFNKEKLIALRYYARAYLHGHSVGGTNPSLLEAMACSNLVIAHDNPFNREVLGDSGLYFATRNELTCIINSLDCNLIEANVLRQKAPKIINARYLWDQIADAYIDLLESTGRAGETTRLSEVEPRGVPPESHLL